jgi:large subunit ribosomal protein L31
MKAEIHPKYETASVKCACGNEFNTRSTMSLIKLDICSNCHPFFTGQQRLVDAAGRVERFGKRFAKTEGKTVVRKAMVQKQIAKSIPKIAGKKVLTSTPAAASKDKDKKKAAH